MMLVREDGADLRIGQVGIQLRGADGRMSEQLLNDAQVGSALQQVRGERVPEGMRRDSLTPARGFR